MIVRCSTPSGELAITGITCRRSGRAIRTVKLPSGRSGTGSPCKRDMCVRIADAVDDQFGIDRKRQFLRLSHATRAAPPP